MLRERLLHLGGIKGIHKHHILHGHRHGHLQKHRHGNGAYGSHQKKEFEHTSIGRGTKSHKKHIKPLKFKL